MKYRVGDRFVARVKGEFLIREVVAVDCDHPHGYHYKMMARGMNCFTFWPKQTKNIKKFLKKYAV